MTPNYLFLPGNVTVLYLEVPLLAFPGLASICVNPWPFSPIETQLTSRL